MVNAVMWAWFWLRYAVMRLIGFHFHSCYGQVGDRPIRWLTYSRRTAVTYYQLFKQMMERDIEDAAHGREPVPWRLVVQNELGRVTRWRLIVIPRILTRLRLRKRPRPRSSERYKDAWQKRSGD